MKYFVTVQGSQADYDAMAGTPSPGSPVWSPDELQAMFTFMAELNDELAASGEFLDGQGFQEPARARFVSALPGNEPVVTDRPYAVSDPQIAGYWLLECESLDRVTEIAARITQCPVPAGSAERPVVIRPVGEGPE
ncbi:YciI family protein [Streptomyces sp. NPDC002054]|uniref:YciI family protein n=1 Tax=Streptomyces sp. NPDC002054 TaxID=3154663 RepID=UPI0033319470